MEIENLCILYSLYYIDVPLLYWRTVGASLAIGSQCILVGKKHVAILNMLPNLDDSQSKF